MYTGPNQSIWVGRDDPLSAGNLWHHNIRFLDLSERIEVTKSPIILGFKSDEGVKRNLGRIGAKAGPDAIRASLSKLSFYHEKHVFDAGDVSVESDLETGQLELSSKTHQLLDAESFPILLGGGHEITYGHIAGVIKSSDQEKIGVVNFDPHFDLRNYENGVHSGSWASQLFDEFDQFRYFPIGINQNANLPSMFEKMRERSQSFMTMDELIFESTQDLIAQISHFIESVDKLVLTVDLDVFSAGVAPGVSALNAFGCFPQHVFPLLDRIADSPKLVSFDIAEMNPQFDDGRTAKLSAQIIDRILTKRLSN